MKAKINATDIVIVSYPNGDYTNNPAKKYQGQQFVVKSKHRVSSRGGDRWLYELHGAVSDMGVPYVFLEDEMIKL